MLLGGLMEWRAAYFTNSLFVVYFGFDVGTAQAVYSCEAPPTGSDCYMRNGCDQIRQNEQHLRLSISMSVDQVIDLISHNS